MAGTDKEVADLYAESATTYGAALTRLARAYEPDPDRRRDLLQEIHIALWRSLVGFDGRCSLRTWVYRVAHNTATSQVIRRRAHTPTLVSLDEVASLPDDGLDFDAFISRIEHEVIRRALERTGGNKAAAATVLNLKRTTLVEKMKRLEGLA